MQDQPSYVRKGSIIGSTMALLQRVLQSQRALPLTVRLSPTMSSSRFFSISSEEDKGSLENKPSQYWHYDAATGQYQRPIFVAATRQHVGKTSSSLAIVSGLMKRFDKVGFIKPVGQQHVEVKSEAGATLRVDKDVCLVREHFHLNHLDYEFMSPVIIPRGYTKKYIDGEISHEQQLIGVHSAMR